MTSAKHFAAGSQELCARARGLENAARSIRQAFEALEDDVDATRGWWSGEAADAYRQGMAACHDAASALISRLEAYPERILSDAGIHGQAEQSGPQTVEQLVFDVDLM